MNKIMYFLRKNLLFFLILILAFFLRIYKIGEIPPSLNWDEVSHGYNAYSILKTGKDEWGKSFPLIFRCFGDYKLPLYIYLTVPVVVALGLTSLSVRFVSVLSGTGLVILTYLLTSKVTRNRLISLFAAFLTAVSPWSFFLSRVAVEANLGAFLFALGMYFLICWTENSKRENLILVSLWWGLSLYAYNSARLLVPVFFLITFIVVLKKKCFYQFILPTILLLLFFLPIIGQFLDKSGWARFEWVSLLDQGTINSIVERRNISKLSPTVSRLIYNRVTYVFYYSARNYLSNLSPRYLFFRGGTHYQFSLPQHELLYLVTSPFLVLGLIRTFGKKNQRERFLGIWFLAAFVPSAITKDAPHVLRSILILPSPMVISALGLQITVNFLKEKSKFGGKLLLFTLMLAVLVSFWRWWQDYLNIYPKAYSWAWQYGYKESAEFIRENYENYDRIYFTKRYGEPHEFVLFYLKYDPKKYLTDQNKRWDYHANWYWVDGFDKFVFVNDWEIGSNLKFKVQSAKCNGEEVRCLLITSPGNYPDRWNKIKTINFLDGKPAFDILEKQKL